jgi:hypothetical protein
MAPQYPPPRWRRPNASMNAERLGVRPVLWRFDGGVEFGPGLDRRPVKRLDAPEARAALNSEHCAPLGWREDHQGRHRRSVAPVAYLVADTRRQSLGAGWTCRRTSRRLGVRFERIASQDPGFVIVAQTVGVSVRLIRLAEACLINTATQQSEPAGRNLAGAWSDGAGSCHFHAERVVFGR